jgi:23S rRNA (guanine2535-N1)-methyltransferase
MPYRFVLEHQDYSDYSGGRVFYSLPGQPAFPVRLASEIFQRCLAIRQARGLDAPCTLYDPCCGGAYHLAALAYLHWQAIARIIGSDIDGAVLGLARRNLSLLTLPGLEQRAAEITMYISLYGKPSHIDALQSTVRLKQALAKQIEQHPLETRVFQADALDAAAFRQGLAGEAIDIVLTDIPYGQKSSWTLPAGENKGSPSPAWRMLEALLGILSPQSLVAVASDKQQKISHTRYQPLEKFQLGKRLVVILKPEIG